MSKIPGVLTTEEAAEILGIHPNSLLRVAGIKRVKRQRIGNGRGAWAWHEGDIRQLAKSYPTKPKTTKEDRVPKYVTRAKKAHAAAVSALVNEADIRLTPELYKLLRKHYEIMVDILQKGKGKKK